MRDGSRQVIAGLQATYAQATGIKSLKVRHNNVLGYFVEVTAANAGILSKPPHAETFIHRQTLANVMRFSTPELAELEARITTAADRALALELDIFARLRPTCWPSRGARRGERGARRARSLCRARRAGGRAALCAPQVDASLVFAVEEGRHPSSSRICAAATARASSAMTASSVPDGGATRILVVTGPNMAGKSTFLRQNALIVVLAQIGLLRAGAARRISASSTGCSAASARPTISPAAAPPSWSRWSRPRRSSIRRRARSFVVLDEIGRGTATFDGLSIAWATLEYLHEVNRSRVLFATHYHELTALADKLPRAANATVEVKEWRDEIVFLYRVVQGAADRSYGIHVAKLAGLPAPVLARANEVLSALEKADGRPNRPTLPTICRCSGRPRAPAEPRPSRASLIEQALARLSPDAMTPQGGARRPLPPQGLLASEA